MNTTSKSLKRVFESRHDLGMSLHVREAETSSCEVLCIETGSLCVSQTGLKFTTILLPQLPACWDYTYTQLSLLPNLLIFLPISHDGPSWVGFIYVEE